MHFRSRQQSATHPLALDNSIVNLERDKKADSSLVLESSVDFMCLLNGSCMGCLGVPGPHSGNCHFIKIHFSCQQNILYFLF